MKKKLSVNKFGILIGEIYPRKKSVEKLITLFKALKIPDTSYITGNFIETNMQKIGNEFNKYFSKRSDHPMTTIKTRFDILFDKDYFKKYLDYIFFIMMNPNTINLSVLAKSTLELTKCLFYNASWMCKNSVYYEIFLTPGTYLLFLKYLLQEDLISIGIQYNFKSSFIRFEIVSFFDFKKRNWEEFKFDNYLQSLLPKNLKNKNPQKDKVKFRNYQKKLPTFQSIEFFKDLRDLNKLNQIKKNSCIDRSKVIGFFKHYIQHQQFDFNLITDKFDFNVKLVKYPTLEKKKRIFIIISQSGSNINPFDLEKTRVFSIFFSDYLQNGWYYGGSFDNILILEYIIKKDDFANKESEWNIGINAIQTKYPNINLKILELKEDLRFFNERSLFFLSLYFDGFNYLKQAPNLELDDLEVKTEFSFIFDSKFHCTEYHPNFLPWEFWHIIGYPISVSIIIEISQDKVNLIKKIITRLPAGQIFTFKKASKSKKITLLAIVQLKNRIDSFFENIIPALNDSNCEYSVSLIVPLTLWENKFYTK